MNKSVIVYGPPGCGKTTNAKRIAAALGLTEIVDDGQEFNPRRPPAEHGVLVLATENPVFSHEWKPRFPKTMLYLAAMRRVERHEAGFPVFY